MIKQGDIFQLGQHRLMCGDATDINDINKLIGGDKIDLVLTDPPYGNKIQTNHGTIGWQRQDRMLGFRKTKLHYTSKKYTIIANNDNMQAANKHYEIAKNISKKVIIWGGNYYTDFLPISRGWIFWDKHMSGSFGDGELAWTNCSGHIKRYDHKWNGIIREGSQSLNGKTRVHPTQKPVELHMRILKDFSKEGDVILDCFGGSGTTLIACEQVNRKCLMMEISPEYCEIIINRWEKLSPLTNKAHELETRSA